MLFIFNLELGLFIFYYALAEVDFVTKYTVWLSASIDINTALKFIFTMLIFLFIVGPLGHNIQFRWKKNEFINY